MEVTVVPAESVDWGTGRRGTRGYREKLRKLKPGEAMIFPPGPKCMQSYLRSVANLDGLDVRTTKLPDGSVAVKLRD